MNILIGVIVGLIVLMLLVTAHEFGHFIAARRNGVSVTEFGIGFPPRAIAWRKDPETGKWHRFPRKEWPKDRMNRVVFSEAKKSENSAKPAKNSKSGTKNAKNSKDQKVAESEKFEFCQRGMIFSLNWLPIGGFCQMDGETNSDERKGTFGAASFKSKTIILFSGVAANWLVAVVILTILAWTGMPEFIPEQFTVPADTRTEWVPVMVGEVIENSPAAQAGIEAGDLVLAVDGNEVTYGRDITNYNNSKPGETVEFDIVRGVDETCAKTVDWETVKASWIGNEGEGDASGGETNESENTSAIIQCADGPAELIDTKVTLNGDDAEYRVGISMISSEAMRYSTWSAPVVGVGLTAQLTGETFKGVGQLVWNLITGMGSLMSPDATVRENGQETISSVGDQVSGPVGIIGVLFPAFTAAGPTNLAFLTALISISLACMNVLPIPALDGGRWLLIAIFRLRHKKLTKDIEEKIVSRAFLILLILIFVVTILDIVRIIR